ncbi:hypothetical protein RUM44_013564 [Polyplax serrata]|uniref:Uncharacterized protein n=1 Tax=Polyplax serrata TaxID=468196 RepID=A0ABR1BEI2_POLSC
MLFGVPVRTSWDTREKTWNNQEDFPAIGRPVGEGRLVVGRPAPSPPATQDLKVTMVRMTLSARKVVTMTVWMTINGIPIESIDSEKSQIKTEKRKLNSS